MKMPSPERHFPACSQSQWARGPEIHVEHVGNVGNYPLCTMWGNLHVV